MGHEHLPPGSISKEESPSSRNRIGQRDAVQYRQPLINDGAGCNQKYRLCRELELVRPQQLAFFLYWRADYIPEYRNECKPLAAGGFVRNSLIAARGKKFADGPDFPSDVE